MSEIPSRLRVFSGVLQKVGMKITICTFGTRGEAQSYLALAVGLQQAGHTVTLAAPHNFAEWIRAYGVKAHPMHFSAQEFMQKPEVKAALKGRNVVQLLKTIRYLTVTLYAQVLDDCWQAAQEAEYVVLDIATCAGVDIASQRDIPMAFVALQPMFPPTRAFPNFILPFRFSLGDSYNHLTYSLFLRAVWPIVEIGRAHV
jgi:sterol 3beta-glucosyltransferase